MPNGSTSLFASCHGQPQFIQGECGDLNVVRQLLAMGGMHSLVLSGISCQPFSVGGDRKGLSDPRSISLPHTLRTAWLLQAPVIVLECTPEIQKDENVQALLRRFQEATGCFLTQSLVALQDIWCTKRERWFAVFSAGPIGPIAIPPPPALRDFQVVGDVMPYVVSWSDEDQSQLELSLYELSRFYSFAAGGIEKAFLDLKAHPESCRIICAKSDLGTSPIFLTKHIQRCQGLCPWTAVYWSHITWGGQGLD